MNKKGFTLIELLIAVAVISIIVSLVVGFLQASYKLSPFYIELLKKCHEENPHYSYSHCVDEVDKKIEWNRVLDGDKK